MANSRSDSESVNFWPDSKCAKAFWNQHELRPYRELFDDTMNWLEPKPGQRWLDLGCGSGRLSQGLWKKSGGQLSEVVGLDCAAVNDEIYHQLGRETSPAPQPDQWRFVAADFSAGLKQWDARHYDGVVSGLSIQYAESYSEAEQRWTTEAYDQVLAEVHRVLRPGGTFVFSVNVANPSWFRVAMSSAMGIFQASRPLRFLRASLRMWNYGKWLTRESRRGRFHYLPLKTVIEKLQSVGFTNIEHRRSYAGQAYVFRCQKPKVQAAAA